MSYAVAVVASSTSDTAAPKSLDEVALFRALPRLRDRVPWARLGDWPTPVQELRALADDLGGPRIWVKREDISAQAYGGNKVRTLEAIMGQARSLGARRIWATGAYGSNHAVATVLHAPAAGLASGAALFPQPVSRPAVDNLSALLSARPGIQLMRNPLELPAVMAWIRRRDRSRDKPFVMAPGGATPEGTFGAMSAALELAEQVEKKRCPAPTRIVVPVGSTCTTAGILVGLRVAERIGLGFGRNPVPVVNAVRVTPWPITSPTRIAHLAWRSARLLAKRLGDRGFAFDFRSLRTLLDLDTRRFGGTYGAPTADGYRAVHLFQNDGGPPLDIVYSAKAAASLVDIARKNTRGPLLFWATKSSVPLPAATEADLAAVPNVLRQWARHSSAGIRPS